MQSRSLSAPSAAAMAAVLTAFLAALLAACAGGPAAAPPGAPAAASAAAAGPAGQDAAKERAELSSRGAARLGAGDLEGAYAAYAAAGDKAGLAVVEDRALRGGAKDLYARAWQESRKTLVFRDDFADNVEGWNVRADEYGLSSIAGGKLVFSDGPAPGNKGGAKLRRPGLVGTSYFRPTSVPALDSDFRVEALLKATAAPTGGEYLSLGWGLEDIKSCVEFSVSARGNYCYGHYADGKWVADIDWTSSPAIKPGLAANKLAMRKSGDELLLYVNDQLVGTGRCEGRSAGEVGLAFDASASVEAEYFLAERYPPASGAWEEAGAAALAAGDKAAAVERYSLAGDAESLASIAKEAAAGGDRALALSALEGTGLSEAGARTRLASVLAAAGKGDAALAELRGAGWRLESSFARDVLVETFDDNSRDWAVRSDDALDISVRNGSYHVESKTAGGRNTWNEVALDRDLDFRIEARVRKLSGPDDQTFSLMWGFSDSGTRPDFGITGGGGFEYGYFEKGKWTKVLGEDRSPAVRPGNAENLLAVVRSGDKLGLFVNGARVGEAPFRPILGDRMGFAIYADMACEVDELRVEEFAPAYALDLARPALYQGREGAYRAAVARTLEGRGMLDEALAEYAAAGDGAGAAACALELGNAALAAGDAAKAVEGFLRSGNSPEAYRGLAAAYERLGKADEAQSAKASLAAALFDAGKRDEALGLYRGLAKPALLSAGAGRFLGAGDFLTAAGLFRAAGDAAKERECYSREADRLAKAGEAEAAIGMYRKAGDEAKAAQAEKRLVVLSPVPLVGAKGEKEAARGLRIVDAGGFSVEVSEPAFEGGAPRFLLDGSEVTLSLDKLASASFDWAKGAASAVTPAGEKLSLKAPEDGGPGGISVEGVVYQADLKGSYRIDLADVRSIAAIDLSVPARDESGAPAMSGARADWATGGAIVDLKGARLALSDIRFYGKGSFDTGYSYGFGFGPGIQGSRLEELSALRVPLGKGTCEYPLASIAGLSPKAGSLVTASGFRCPLAGKDPGFLVVSGRLTGRVVAMYPAAIAEISAELGSGPAPAASEGEVRDRSGAEGDDRRWSAALLDAAGAKAGPALSKAKAEVLSPAIDWSAADSVLAFRAALRDYSELGEPNDSRSSMVWQKTWAGSAVPIAIGQACWAVDFGVIDELGLDSKGVLSIKLGTGEVLKGQPYKNWLGLVGESALGTVRVERKKLPARVVLKEEPPAGDSAAR